MSDHSKLISEIDAYFADPHNDKMWGHTYIWAILQRARAVLAEAPTRYACGCDVLPWCSIHGEPARKQHKGDDL